MYRFIPCSASADCISNIVSNAAIRHELVMATVVASRLLAIVEDAP
jgi:hypothetical protein